MVDIIFVVRILYNCLIICFFFLALYVQDIDAGVANSSLFASNIDKNEPSYVSNKKVNSTSKRKVDCAPNLVSNDDQCKKLYPSPLEFTSFTTEVNLNIIFILLNIVSTKMNIIQTLFSSYFQIDNTCQTKMSSKLDTCYNTFMLDFEKKYN